MVLEDIWATGSTKVKKISGFQLDTYRSQHFLELEKQHTHKKKSTKSTNQKKSPDATITSPTEINK